MGASEGLKSVMSEELSQTHVYFKNGQKGRSTVTHTNACGRNAAACLRMVGTFQVPEHKKKPPEAVAGASLPWRRSRAKLQNSLLYGPKAPQSEMMHPKFTSLMTATNLPSERIKV